MVGIGRISLLCMSAFAMMMAKAADELHAEPELNAINSYGTDSLYSDWEDQGIDLEQVVVTATRTPKLVSDAPVLTQLISNSDIRRLDATCVSDILSQELPGVEFSYSMNMQVNMNMAGFAGQSVLFLVDGERMAGETNDNVDFERLFASGIERIEIVKGAVSALYGSSANGGVINIITKDMPQQPLWNLCLHGRLGAHGERRGGIDLSLGSRLLFNTLNVQYSNIDCFKVNNRSLSPIPLRIESVPGQSVINARDKVVSRLSDNLKLTGRIGYYMRQMVRFPGEAEHSRYYDYSAGLRADYDPTGDDHLELAYSFDQYDKTCYYVPSSLTVSDKNMRLYSNVQNTFRGLWNHNVSDNSTITMGADYMYDYLINAKLSDKSYTQISADAFLQYDQQIGDRWELIGALRYDYFEIGNRSRLTPKLSVYWHKGGFRLRGGYGMGFRVPSLKEMYYDFEAMTGWVIDGNPSLKPELSHNFMLSAEYSLGRYDFVVMGYRNYINDRISTGVPFSAGDGAHLSYVNQSKVHLSGFEMTSQVRFNSYVNAKLSYCFTHEDNSDIIPNQFMPARPHSLNYRIDGNLFSCDKYSCSLSMNGRWLSAVRNKEYLSVQHPEMGIFEAKYPSYHLHRLQVVQHYKDFITMSLTVENLFDYIPDNYYYNAPLTSGRTISLGVSISLK